MFVRISFLISVVGLLAVAHEIPRDVTVQLWMQPEAVKMRIALRVPLKAMRDVQYSELPGGYLDVEKLAPQLHEVATTWIGNAITLRENDQTLAHPRVVATRLSIQSDRSFDSFADASQNLLRTGLKNEAMVVWDQLWLDVLLESPIVSTQSSFAIRPGMEKLGARVLTVLHFGPDRVYHLLGDPGIVPLDPGWWQAFQRFVVLGFWHILDGTDHLLFLFCLVIPMQRLRDLAAVATAFALGHSVTLIGSAFGLAPDALWFPALIEFLIAVSILLLALENLLAEKGRKRRWALAFVFGLIHGFGFSFALRESMQFAGRHILPSLLAFNLGVEAGQLLVLLLLAPAVWLLFRYVAARRTGTIILSALAAHTGWHWMLDRWDLLRKFWPLWQ